LKINFILNGNRITLDVPPSRRVIDILRENLELTGTKEACGEGECGACTILVDGKSVLSCLMLAPQLEGKEIMTVEGVSSGDMLHPVQEAFVTEGAVQCGFCTPGMIMQSVYLLSQNPSPTKDEIREGISGNLCRCTGYQKIVDAIHKVSLRVKKGSEK
jgi:aerobic-type carbon monoxide dehydrogenase small subunit (CoxS/CutS family)